jgi:two-component system, LytTR family, sensor histidine kinase AlgZ
VNSSASRLLAPVLLRLTRETAAIKTEPLLPQGLWWVYLVGPPFFVAIIDADLLLGDFDGLWRALVVSYIHTAAVTGPLHLAYTFALPRAYRLTESKAMRAGFHVLAVSIAVPLGTFAIKPIIIPICKEPRDVREALIISYAIAIVLLLAAIGYQRLRQRAAAVERMAVSERQAALTAQLRELQSRTNPHFLFNSLNAVASMIPTDPIRAEQTVERLANVLRHSLQRTRRSWMHVAEEIDVVREYLEIESVRFGERLAFRIDVDPRIKRVNIPPMALEPLVENAVLHGVGSARAGGTIAIVGRRVGDELELSVSDDGPGCGGSVHAGTGTGLADLRERLRLIYGRDDLLVIERGPTGGCRAVLTLPISR